MELYQRIVFIRKKKGLTQEQLAELTSVSVRTIQRIECGESVPRSYTVKAIAVALGVSFEELTAVATAVLPADPIPGSSVEETQYSLQLLCLSCFSYLVIPWVHFLVPAYVLKRSKLLDARAIAFGRQVVRRQIYWVVSVSLILLLVLAYNLISIRYLERPLLLHYLWPFFFMYFFNAVMIVYSIRQIRQVLPPTK